jgi:hypothetical protein
MKLTLSEQMSLIPALEYPHAVSRILVMIPVPTRQKQSVQRLRGCQYVRTSFATLTQREPATYRE